MNRPLAALLISLWLAGCKKEPDVFRATMSTDDTWPFSTTSTAQVPNNVPDGLDLYLPFQTPFPSSATHRLKTIDVYAGARFFARSSFKYDKAGNLITRSYLADYPYLPFNYLSTYYYNDLKRIERKTLADLTGKSTPVNLTYSYTNGQLTTLTYQTGPNERWFTLNARTMYRYPSPAITQRIRLGYFNSAVAPYNVPTPVDSTHQWVTTTGQTTVTIDSVWDVSYNRQFLRRVISSKVERDAKGNAVSIPIVTRNYDTTTYRFAHYYTGPGGLLGRSENQTPGLSYRFTYEPN